MPNSPDDPPSTSAAGRPPPRHPTRRPPGVRLLAPLAQRAHPVRSRAWWPPGRQPTSTSPTPSRRPLDGPRRRLTVREPLHPPSPSRARRAAQPRPPRAAAVGLRPGRSAEAAVVGDPRRRHRRHRVEPRRGPPRALRGDRHHRGRDRPLRVDPALGVRLRRPALRPARARSTWPGATRPTTCARPASRCSRPPRSPATAGGTSTTLLASTEPVLPHRLREFLPDPRRRPPPRRARIDITTVRPRAEPPGAAACRGCGQSYWSSIRWAAEASSSPVSPMPVPAVDPGQQRREPDEARGRG